MGQKDSAQNDYLNDKVRFADMCNGILFCGKDIIRPEELQEVSGDIVYWEGQRRRKMIPDKVRLWKGLYLAIISVENQTMIDYSMVFRMMKEEALSYEHQWDERERELRQKGVLGKKTRLCWYGKNEKFVPVIPIVIYYGTDKEWDGATCLHDMLEMDEVVAPFITNYKLNLFDYHEYKDFTMFKTENRELFEVLSCAKNEESMDSLIHTNESRYEELPYYAAQTICDIAGIDIALVKKVNEEGREVACMCKAWDDHKESGRREGRKEGIQQGIKQGIRAFIEDKMEDKVPEEIIVTKLISRFSLDEEKAKDYYREYGAVV